MPDSKKLANKIRAKLSHMPSVVEQPKMGGISFMVNGKMCVRAAGEEIMLRCEPGMTEELLARKGARRFVMKGKPMMKGWLVISPEGFNSKKDFDYWIKIALDYNDKIKEDSRKKRSA